MLLSGLAVGALLGAVMQRGRFCVTGMLRDLFTLRQSRGLAALFIVIAVHAVGLAALTSAGVIAPDYPTFKPVAVVAGGFLFGMSIILAGGCASGTWYRSAEGLVGSWLALLFYGLSAASMKTGALAGFNTWVRHWDTGWTTLPATFGVSAWWCAVPLAAGTAWAVHRLLRRDAARPKAALQEPWYRKPLHPYTAGVLIGLLGVIAWPLSATTGRNDGLGITTPTAHVVDYVVSGEGKYLNWGTLLVLGLFFGAFVAAKGSGEFRVRVPDATTTLRSIAGGIGMGIGASLAGGCTVGNGMVQTSLFSYQGWVGLAAITAGVYVASLLWLSPSAARGSTSAALRSGETVRSAEDNVIDTDPVNGARPVNLAHRIPTATGVVALAPTAQGARGASRARLLPDGRYALDTLGAVCPFPLIEAREAMGEISDGDRLVIDFDCTQATESIPQWAADNGHAVEAFSRNRDAGWQITLVKNAAARVR